MHILTNYFLGLAQIWGTLGIDRIRQMASTSAVPAVYLTPPAERCPVNLLPNELLSYIFELGTLAQSVTWDEQPSEDEWETDSESDASMSEIGPDVEVLDVKSDDEDGGDNVSFGSRPPYFEVLVSHICQKWRGEHYILPLYYCLPYIDMI